jgi:hypothetical protein
VLTMKAPRAGRVGRQRRFRCARPRRTTAPHWSGIPLLTTGAPACPTCHRWQNSATKFAQPGGPCGKPPLSCAPLLTHEHQAKATHVSRNANALGVDRPGERWQTASRAFLRHRRQG